MKNQNVGDESGLPQKNRESPPCAAPRGHPPPKHVYKANRPAPRQRSSRPPEPDVPKAPKKKKLWQSLVSDVLFFAVLLGVVLGVGMYKQMFKGGGSILGYSFYSVLTQSMEREIPKGSLVIVKATPGPELQVGDDITFYRDPQTVVTHRIVQVLENYENSGGRGFVTQGIENPMPDEEAVHEANVVGKVVHTFPGVGYAATLIGTNLKWVVVLLALLFVLATSLRVFFSSRTKPAKKPKPPTKACSQNTI